MFSYFAKSRKNSDAVSDKYVAVNNFGYNDGVEKMQICREEGRSDYQLIYVKSGRLSIKDGGDDMDAVSGSVALFRPGEPQIYSVDGEKTSYFWIHFSGREIENMLSFFKEKIYNVGPFPEFERFCQRYISEIEPEEKYSELFSEGGLITLVAHIAERTSKAENKSSVLSKIRPAIEFMKADNGERYSNEELAELCGINKYYFLKLFKSVMGITPQQYYQSLIIDKSVYLLTNTPYTVSEISALCGIEDVFYFSRMFKKHTGISPREYRKKIC
jgi:AraC-like DNA-binding protein